MRRRRPCPLALASIAALLLAAAGPAEAARPLAPTLLADREVAQAPILESLAELRRGEQRSAERVETIEKSLAEIGAAAAAREGRLDAVEASLSLRIADLRADLRRYFAVAVAMWGATLVALLGVGWEISKRLERERRA